MRTYWTIALRYDSGKHVLLGPQRTDEEWAHYYLYKRLQDVPDYGPKYVIIEIEVEEEECP